MGRIIIYWIKEQKKSFPDCTHITHTCSCSIHRPKTCYCCSSSWSSRERERERERKREREGETEGRRWLHVGIGFFGSARALLFDTFKKIIAIHLRTTVQKKQPKIILNLAFTDAFGQEGRSQLHKWKTGSWEIFMQFYISFISQTKDRIIDFLSFLKSWKNWKAKATQKLFDHSGFSLYK